MWGMENKKTNQQKPTATLVTTTTTTLGNISSLQFVCVPLFSGRRRSIPGGKYLSTAIPCLTKSSNPCLLEACLSFSLALQCLFRWKHARSQNISIAITEHVAAFPIHFIAHKIRHVFEL
jgi:hypothetical protein